MLNYDDAVELDAAMAGLEHDFVTFPELDHNLSGDKTSKEKSYSLFLEYALTYLN